MSIERWNKAWAECVEGIDLNGARVGGAATIANPNKEDAIWWNNTGPKWLETYINWRKNNPEWKVWVAPDGQPAIELAMAPVIAGVQVKMILDRIFEVNGELVIVDLKTSKQLPSSALQLGMYRAGIQATYGIDIKFGNYYMSRKSGTGMMIDLTKYTYDKIEYLVAAFDKARKAGLFLPNNSNCNTICGLTDYCQFYTEKIG
jgi:hypothetical protein